jgi:hypothetical protein
VAERSVVKEQLDSGAIAAGETLTSLLRKTDFGLVCSLWIFSQDSNDWSLVLASPRVGTQGPLQGYKIIHNVLAADTPTAEQLEPFTINVVRPNIPLVRAIRSLGDVGVQNLLPEPAVHISVPKRLRTTSIDGVFIEDAYIYFVQSSEA